MDKETIEYITTFISHRIIDAKFEILSRIEHLENMIEDVRVELEDRDE